MGAVMLLVQIKERHLSEQIKNISLLKMCLFLLHITHVLCVALWPPTVLSLHVGFLHCEFLWSCLFQSHEINHTWLSLITLAQSWLYDQMHMGKQTRKVASWITTDVPPLFTVVVDIPHGAAKLEHSQRGNEGFWRQSIDVSRKLRAKTTQRGGNEPVDHQWMLFLSLLWCFFLWLVTIHELSGHMRTKSFLRTTSSTSLSYGVFGGQCRKN